LRSDAREVAPERGFAIAARSSPSFGVRHGRADRVFRLPGLTIFNLDDSWRVIFNPELAISADHVFCILEASGQRVV
jgi:hypothetical protein